MSARRVQSPSRSASGPDPSRAGGSADIPGSPPGPPLPGAPRRRLDSATGLALLAVVIAAVALVLGLLNALGPGRAGCQAAAWDAVPAAAALPAGWTLGATDFYVGSQTTTLVGPMTDETTGGGAVVYASITCYGDSAGDALERSRSSAESAGATVEDLPGVGDEGYAMSDSSTGSSAYHFRRGALVAYMAVSGAVTPAELDQIAVAVDAAMTTSQGGAAPTGLVRPTEGPPTSETPGSSTEVSPSPEESVEPEPSPVAAALEARLPSAVDGVALTKDSATGDVLAEAEDTPSRALVAAVRSLGKSPSDLLLAQAYDETGALAAYLTGFELPGVEGTALKTVILKSWLLADSPGVTTTEVTVSGKPLTRVSYGDDRSDSYVYVSDGAVLIIDTADADEAGRIVASLP